MVDLKVNLIIPLWFIPPYVRSDCLEAGTPYVPHHLSSQNAASQEENSCIFSGKQTGQEYAFND